MPKRLFSSFLFVVLLFAIVGSGIVLAEDPCKKIGDLDDKAVCYEDQIEENEKKYESTSKKLSSLREEKNSVSDKINGLLSQLSVTQAELNSIQAEITEMTNQLDLISTRLTDKNEQLQKKIDLRNRVIRNFTKQGILNDLEFFGRANATGLTGFEYSTFSYMFESSLNIHTLRLINVINTEIDNYEQNKAEAASLKEELEVAQQNLLAVKSQIDSERNLAQGNLNELSSREDNYESELASLQDKINELSSKQQEILRKKFGDGSGSVGDYESPTWSVPDAPFDPAFGAFSYGAYTHYRGLSQYGAKGRAEDGKSYKDIIEFYYDEKVDTKDDLPDSISVDGYGSMSFQYYLYGLAEMPSDWPMDALKAQAVAARTFAHRYIKAGKTICTTQSCQVFLQSKAENPPDRWKEAVDETKNKIIEGDVHAMYSSTTGGYIDDGIGWDVDGSWPNDAYEKKGDSPWFYWAWYSSNYRFDSDTCGRSHPWLDEEEMADILNAWVVWDKGSSSDRDKISPVTTGCWGGNPYSLNDMAKRADELGDKYTSVSSVDTDIGNNGRTSRVTFKTNKGSVSIEGDEFKTVFNLRAPGYLSIRSRLYEIQKD